MPKISVIIPVYNVEKYLPECLDSIINQTLKDIEIICVNDVSPDSSASILEEYAEKDNRIKIITHDINQGLGPARNSGVAQATSPFIAFVDSDDYVAPNMMDVLYDKITSHNADLAWCGTAKVSETGIIIDPGRIPEGIWTATDILDCEKLYPSIQTVTNKLFVKEIIKDIKQLPILIEDEPTIVQYLSKCNKIVTVGESYYFYREAPESLSNPSTHTSKYWEQFFDDYKIYFNILLRHFKSPSIVRKQTVFRHKSLLWRVNKYSLLLSPTWKEQEKIILFNIRNDSLRLKEACPVMYRYLLFSLRFNKSKKIKKKLFKIGLKLSRNVWIIRSSYLMLPFDILKAISPEIKRKIKSLLDYFEICIYKIVGNFYKTISKKPVWLVGERHDTAQENGLYFYKYLKTEQKNEKAYYIIDKNCSQYNAVKNFGNIIQFKSLKHKVLFFASKYYVTAHNHYCFPVTFFGKKRIKPPNSLVNVFLDHGITYADVSEFYGKEKSGIDLFICGAKPEKDYVLNNFGYSNNEVVYTGFARFDGLHTFEKQNQILVMPTWRRDIYNLKDQSEYEKEKIFKKTKYYKTFQSLLTNEKLLSLLETYDYQLIFYPHYEIQNYLKHFSSNHTSITIASKDKFIVQDLLKSAALLVTDTSSVHFDFAYMFKPVIYYRFDKENFIKSHYRPGYFDHNKNGFGEVVEEEKPLITLIEKYLINGCQMEEMFFDRVKKFYPLHDTKNCERIYNSIIANK